MPDTKIATEVRDNEPFVLTPPLSYAQIRPFAAIVAGVAWIFFLGVGEAASPPPDPAVTPGTVAVLIELAFVTALMVSIAGLSMRQRWGLGATAAGGGILVLGSLYCVATGHPGLIALVQAIAGFGLAAVGVGLARSPFARNKS